MRKKYTIEVDIPAFGESKEEAKESVKKYLEANLSPLIFEIKD